MSKYSEQVRQDAAKAAAYIREHGWCQDRMFKDQKACAVGACWKGTEHAGETEDQHFGRDYHLFRAIATEVGGRVANWNDAPGRTKEEVLAVFEAIANS